MATHSHDVLDAAQTDEDQQYDVTTESGELHGGYGSASLKECLEKIASENREPKRPDVTTSAALHSGEGTGASSSHCANAPQRRQS